MRVWTAVGILVAATSVLVHADQDQAKGPSEGSRSVHGLNLTQDQRTQVKSLWREAKDTNEPLRKELGQLRQELRSEAFSETPDEGKIQDLKDRLSKVQSDLLASHVATERKMAALLSPEQRNLMRSGQGFGRHRHHRDDTDRE